MLSSQHSHGDLFYDNCCRPVRKHQITLLIADWDLAPDLSISSARYFIRKELDERKSTWIRAIK